jgi:biotin carboxylase
MTGPEVSVESYSIDGVPHIITITDKMVTDVPYFVELGHTEPCKLPQVAQEDIKKVATAAINAIGMLNGPTHTEIKVTPNGAKLVEIAARLGGDFITSKLVPLSTGVDMIECSFASLLGERVPLEKKFQKSSAIRFIQGKDGILKQINGIEKVKDIDGVVEIEIYKNIGEKVCKAHSSNDRLGHIIIVGDTADEVEKVANKAISEIEIIVE